MARGDPEVGRDVTREVRGVMFPSPLEGNARSWCSVVGGVLGVDGSGAVLTNTE